MKKYNYDWKTEDELVANIHTKMKFGSWGITTIAEIAECSDIAVFRKAHQLWLKLKDAFNLEAEVYGKFCDSKLGSIGDIKEREVLRARWWDTLDGDDYGDYDTLTAIIEVLHRGEELETGRILFGS